MSDHEAHVEMVHDARGYTVGWTITCSCDWRSSELREHPATTIRDHWAHLLDVYAPTKETA